MYSINKNYSYLDLERLNNYVEKKLLRVNKKDDLFIYNYTDECVFSKAWDEYTTICRGLVVNSSGEIIAKPLKKFFNINETEETMERNLPVEIPEVSEKIDGSLIILYKYNDNYMFSTRGIFDSVQAVMAKKIFEKKYNYDGLSKYKGFTFCFEVVYPENIIVIDYRGIEDLFLISVINNETGVETSYEEASKIAYELGFKCVSFTRMDIKNIDLDEKGKEGYVLRYSNGLRVKVKLNEYVRIARFLQSITPKNIIEVLKRNIDPSSLYTANREDIDLKVKEMVCGLKNRYDEIIYKVDKIYNETPKFESRKEYALYFMDKIKENKELSKFLFLKLDNKEEEYHCKVWDFIKNSKEISQYKRSILNDGSAE